MASDGAMMAFVSSLFVRKIWSIVIFRMFYIIGTVINLYIMKSLIYIVLWIIIVLFVVRKAGELQRSKLGWGVFALFLPVIALIVILLIGPNKK